MIKIFKRTKILIIVIVIIFFVAFLLSRGCVFKKEDLEYGVTFSPKQARDLGFNAKELYIKILDELKVKRIRLAAYWDIIEEVKDKYNWEELDWFLAEAEKRNIKVVLAVGGRLPRWPECHFPEWSKALSDEEREKAILQYIRSAVIKYRDLKSIEAWQVENEPFLPHFGECPDLDPNFLDQEISLVKSLDTRPILLTDSGELSIWVPAAKRADVFGTTMYRDTYSDVLERYIHYPIEPGFFRFKKNISRLFASPERWLVIELQAEPWGPEPFQYLSKEERDKTMNLEKFREILEFSRKAGFQEFYLWGVEWWAWECERNGECGIWNEAKGLFGE
jgi:MoaA/NifB/PqqE/SkfB family radical SAM enzyme